MLDVQDVGTIKTMSEKDALIVVAGAAVLVLIVIIAIFWILSNLLEQVLHCCERAFGPSSDLQVALRQEAEATHGVTVELMHDSIHNMISSVNTVYDEWLTFNDAAPGFRIFFSDLNAVYNALSQVEAINRTIESAQRLNGFHQGLVALCTRTSQLFHEILPEIDRILRVRNAVSSDCTKVSVEQDAFLQVTNNSLRLLKRSIQLYFEEVNEIPHLERILGTTMRREITEGLGHDPTVEENELIEQLHLD